MVVLLLLAGIVESLGAISLVPLLGDLLNTGGEPSGVLLTIRGAFVSVGISPTLETLLVVVCGAMAVKGALTLLAFQQAGYMEAGIATKLRMDFLDGLLNTRWAFFTSRPAGELTHALSMECAQAGLAMRLFAQLTSLILQAVAYLIVGAFVSWQILAAGLIGGGVFFFAFRRLISSVRQAGGRVVESMNSMTALFADALTGVKPLKVMGLESRCMKYIKTQALLTHQAVRQRVLGVGLLTAVQEPVLAILLALGLYFASQRLHMEATTLLAMAFFFQRIMTRFSSAQQCAQQFAALEGTLISLQGKIQEIKQFDEGHEGTLSLAMRKGVSLEDVCVDIGAKRVLDHVSLTARVGEITLLRGPSGVGKTTVADSIAKLVQVSSGRILVDNTPLDELETHAWRKQIGYVPQEVFLFNDSIRNNIVLGRDYTDEQVWRALEKAGADTFVREQSQGLDFVVGEHGRSLSGGQRQRLMIARALVSGPALLIMDESTTGLDRATEKAIVGRLVELKSEMAILFISHQEGVSAHADAVFTLSPPSDNT